MLLPFAIIIQKSICIRLLRGSPAQLNLSPTLLYMWRKYFGCINMSLTYCRINLYCNIRYRCILEASDECKPTFQKLHKHKLIKFTWNVKHIDIKTCMYNPHGAKNGSSRNKAKAIVMLKIIHEKVIIILLSPWHYPLYLSTPAKPDHACDVLPA